MSQEDNGKAIINPASLKTSYLTISEGGEQKIEQERFHAIRTRLNDQRRAEIWRRTTESMQCASRGERDNQNKPLSQLGFQPQSCPVSIGRAVPEHANPDSPTIS